MGNFGESLKRERELREISLREIADATKVNIRYLEALEHNRFDILPGGVFNKGFIRAYARFIGADSEALVDRYLQEMAAREASTPGAAAVAGAPGLHRPQEAPRRRADAPGDTHTPNIVFAENAERRGPAEGPVTPPRPRAAQAPTPLSAPRAAGSRVAVTMLSLAGAAAVLVVGLIIVRGLRSTASPEPPLSDVPTKAADQAPALQNGSGLQGEPGSFDESGSQGTSAAQPDPGSSDPAEMVPGGERANAPSETGTHGVQEPTPADGSPHGPAAPQAGPTDTRPQATSPHTGAVPPMSAQTGARPAPAIEPRIASPIPPPSSGNESDRSVAQAPPRALPAGMDFRLEATAPVWVQVACDGEERLNRSLAAGEGLSLRCLSVIRVSATDAGAVRLSVNGAPCAPMGAHGARVEGFSIRAEDYHAICPPGTGSIDGRR